ncbi:MAG: PHP domain-containing protein [Clostridiales bacterium]|nr:PHP domain-containing protein [Clostridiales bacterium]
MYLISPNQKQYKANLHCHSTLSDGKKTPEELKEMYRAHGYQILAITDHEVPKSHTDMTEDDFLMLTGYECYIRDNPTGTYDLYGQEVHLNLFARDPRNETMICPHEPYIKYIKPEDRPRLICAGSARPREYTREYIAEYLKTARENGYLVSYNHPVWSMENEEDILAQDGYFSLEIVNYSAFLLNHLENNGALYDKMLRSGKRIFCHAADDNHNKFPEDHPECDSFGGFTMILAEDLSYDSVIHAMEKGEMYASMGPVFNEITFDGENLHIECSPARHIFAYTGSKSPRHLHTLPGEEVTSADFVIDPRATYVRVAVVDAEGRMACTRGFFRDELNQ